VEQIAIAAALRFQSHSNHVRAGPRLRHRERANMLTGDELGEILLFLRRTAVATDLVHAEGAVRAVGESDLGRGARDLFDRDDVREVAHRRSAVLLFHRDAEQPERAELAPQVGGELVGLIDLCGARRDLLDGERPHSFAQHGDRLAVIELEHVHGVSGVSASIMRVCSMVATCVPLSAYTSARATESVRPGFTTFAFATSVPRPGFRMFILYSTVTSEQSAGMSENAL